MLAICDKWCLVQIHEVLRHLDHRDINRYLERIALNIVYYKAEVSVEGSQAKLCIACHDTRFR